MFAALRLTCAGELPITARACATTRSVVMPIAQSYARAPKAEAIIPTTAPSRPTYLNHVSMTCLDGHTGAGRRQNWA